MIAVIKAHAYGNDFLYVDERQTGERDPVEVARAVCDRHRGIGADGLILYRPTPAGAEMRLFNADGSPAEVSGNGVRGLATILVREGTDLETIVIGTQAGDKTLQVLEVGSTRSTFRAAMGRPEDIRQVDLETAVGRVGVVTLWMGNPQCVVLAASPEPVGDAAGEARLRELGPALTRHPAFPEGTNVELVTVDGPDRIRIWIWERGVGRTESSGTGACAAAVAAAAHGGVGRDVAVTSPGGTQRVEWRDDGVYLTGWAEIVLDGHWLG